MAHPKRLNGAQHGFILIAIISRKVLFRCYGSIFNFYQLNYHRITILDKSMMATSQIAASKITLSCSFPSNRHIVCEVTFDQPLFLKAT